MGPPEIFVTALESGERKLCVLCYPGAKKTWYRIWMNPKIRIEGSSPDTPIDVYYGNNVTEVEEREKSNTFFQWPTFSLLRKEFAFEPFNLSCIGLASTNSYTVYFKVRNPDVWFVLYTVLGLFIFFFAPSMSRNTLLQYSTGISVGVLGSILVALFIASRFLPQKLKNVGLVIVTFSASLSMYLYQWVTIYLNDILTNHWQILAGYVVLAGLVSFAVVYRYGPISDHRTLNLVKWSLQFVGLVLVYHGTQISEISIAIIIVALGMYHFPPSVFGWLKKIRYRYFPPKIRLLTEEEFYLEGEIETKRALKELREFCQSPDCNAWRTISRLSSPNRFASFIEGEGHMLDQEIEDHDLMAERYPLDLSDDSDDSEQTR